MWVSKKEYNDLKLSLELLRDKNINLSTRISELTPKENTTKFTIQTQHGVETIIGKRFLKDISGTEVIITDAWDKAVYRLSSNNFISVKEEPLDKK